MTMLVPRILNNIVESRGLFLQNSEMSRRPAVTEPKKSIQKEISTSLSPPAG
jgi:hypothetical protein